MAVEEPFELVHLVAAAEEVDFAPLRLFPGEEIAQKVLQSAVTEFPQLLLQRLGPHLLQSRRLRAQ